MKTAITWVSSMGLIFIELHLKMEAGMEGMDGYDTAEEAKAAAEADAESYGFYEEEEESLLDVLDDEGEWDAYWDAIAHERMEIEKGLF